MANVLALDLGSTQLKLLLLDGEGQLSYVDAVPYETQTPRAGWIEQRPQDWTAALAAGMRRLREAMPGAEIDAIGFSGHMSGVVLLDAQGEALYPCITLSDTRSEAESVMLCGQVGELIRRETGNPVNNAFSLPKLCWLKAHEPELWTRSSVFLAPKDYLRAQLTGRVATETTDAYNTLCVSMRTRRWCPEIIRGAGLEMEKFPPLLEPTDCAGHVTPQAARRFLLPQGVPVFAGGADMACGAVGMGLFDQGESALTLGTSATFLAPVSQVDSDAWGQVTFHLHALPGLLYALGSHFNGGLAVNWLTRMLSGDGTLRYEEIERLSQLAKQVPPGSNGVLTLPFLAGSGSPYFCAQDRQTVFGLSAATRPEELFRSELEGITLNLAQTKRLFDRMIPSGLACVRLGGGGAKVGIWPQMLADVFGTRIDLSRNVDASAVGAAILAGAGAGLYADIRSMARSSLSIGQALLPQAQRHRQYAALAARYEAAYAQAGRLYARPDGQEDMS